MRYRRLGSTNDAARKLALDGAREGTVVIADFQTMARGRMGRKWIAPKGGLWLSVVLRPENLETTVFKLNMIAGLSIVQSLNKFYGANTAISWPNDIMLEGKKVAGILTEAKFDSSNAFAILGVGVNLNIKTRQIPRHLFGIMNSMQIRYGRHVSIGRFAKYLLSRLSVHYATLKRGSDKNIVSDWKEACFTIGRRVELESEDRQIRGVAVGIDDRGRLRIRQDDGRTILCDDRFTLKSETKSA